MNGLKTSRVVILDDNVNEGAALIKAFSQVGIGASYFTGSSDELPAKKCKGIRLIALDMDLGSGTEDREKIGHLMSCINSILDETCVPFLIIAWTGRKDLVKEFREALLKERPGLYNSHFVVLLKDEMRNERDFDIQRILDKLNSIIAELYPLNLFLDWEQRVHDAATHTTSLLSSLVTYNRSTDDKSDHAGRIWRDEMSGILAILSQEARDHKYNNGSEAFIALLEILNSIHYDRLEYFTQFDIDSVTNTDRLLSPPRNRNISQVSQLNRILLLPDVSDSLSTLRSGNIYFFFQNEGKNVLPGFHDCTFPKSLIDDIYQFNDRQARKEIEKEISDESHPVSIEINPSCDYAQSKARYSRLIPGLFVKSEHYNLEGVTTHEIRSETNYIKTVGPFCFDDNDKTPMNGTYYLILNAHYVSGMKIKDMNTKQPLLRMRKQLLTDVQAWFSGHAARPGYTCVNFFPKKVVESTASCVETNHFEENSFIDSMVQDDASVDKNNGGNPINKALYRWCEKLRKLLSIIRQ